MRVNEQILGMVREEVTAALGERERTRRRPALYAANGTGDGAGEVFPSAGEQLVDSADLKGFRSIFAAPKGGVPRNFMSGGTSIAGGVRALLTSINADLHSPEYLGVVDRGWYRPQRLLQLITVRPTKSDSPEYVVESTPSAQAAPVAEATALTGSSGLKPESAMATTRHEAAIKTIAVWVAATRRALDDGAELRQLVDEGLTADVMREIEDQIVAGNGIGENLSGILNEVAQSVGPPTGTESAFDVIRQGITLVQSVGRTTPTAVLISPADAEALDLAKVDNQINRFVIDPSSPPGAPLFGLPRIVSDVVEPGTAIVGAFGKVLLFDREEVVISVGVQGDQFVRNALTILAEARVGVAVTRPSAFAICELT